MRGVNLQASRGQGAHFRGRGRGRGSWPTAKQAKLDPDMSFVKKELGDLVQDFDPTNAKGVWMPISEVIPTASYSWLDRTGLPTIEVPGSPPTFVDDFPTRVPADQGLRYIDQNSARMGPNISPLAPLFAAVDHMGKGDSLSSYDMISDRNTLRKLLRWVTGSAQEKDFRIDVETVGKTCVFTRREAQDSESVSGFWGYGKNYVKDATYPARGAPDAVGHHRIISIRWGGIKILLRFELDACQLYAEPQSSQDDGNQGVEDVDDLISAMANLTTGGPKVESRVKFGVKVVPDPNQQLVPQDAIAEVKTRAGHKEMDWEETYPQLYLSQTTWLYFAKHFKGVFEPPEKYELGSSSLRPVASVAQVGLGKLRGALDIILRAIRAEGPEAKLCLVCEAGTLSLYHRKPGTGKSLGKDIREMF